VPARSVRAGQELAVVGAGAVDGHTHESTVSGVVPRTEALSV
jgi:hypothetical protein